MAGRCMRFAACAVLLLLAWTWGAAQDDLRAQYGAANLAAAQAVDQAMTLLPTDLHAALQAADAAAKADPACAAALYYRGLAEEGLGNIEESLTALQRGITLDTRGSAVGLDCALRLGSIYSRLKQFDDAHRWYTRAVLRDPGDTWHRQANAYAGLATMFAARGEYGSASVCAYLAAQADPEAADEQADRYAEKAVNSERARVLYTPHIPFTPAKRGGAATLTHLDIKTTDGPVYQVVADPAGRFVVAVAAEKPLLYTLKFR